MNLMLTNNRVLTILHSYNLQRKFFQFLPSGGAWWECVVAGRGLSAI